MDIGGLERISTTAWRIPPGEGIGVPAVIFADEGSIWDTDDKVYEQAANVARLPGIVVASYAMPDAPLGLRIPHRRCGRVRPGGRRSGLGHQIGNEFLKRMLLAAGQSGIRLPDRELACAPIDSPIGQSYLGAMRAGINCALSNRQILTHLTRQAFAEVLPGARIDLLYDVSHNTCKVEEHDVGGRKRRLFIHRKGATRAFGPGHSAVPEHLRAVGQPVLIGGTMGTASYVLAGTTESEKQAFSCGSSGAACCSISVTRRSGWSMKR